MTLSSERERLVSDASLRGMAFSGPWTEVVDRWLGERFDEAVAGAGAGTTDDLALVAVGGYGRGDLAPGSDLDLLLLHRSSTAPAAVAEALWYPIWDEGLKLGHAVRTVADALGLAAEDLDTATSLLTARHLAGSVELTDALRGQALAQWQRRPKRYLALLRTGAEERQARFGEVAFLLEPDLKDGRGGLRDIHALRWAELARPVLEPGDAEALTAAESGLFDARVALHRASRRASNQLTLQEQDAVAADLGTDADGLMGDLARAGRNVAFIADETWDRVSASLSSGGRLLGWRSRNQAPGMVVRGGQVLLEPNVDPAVRPDLVLEVAAVAATKHAHLARVTLDRLAARTPELPTVWATATRDRFVALLATGHDAIGVIEALDHAGLWERYLPEWIVVRNRPQRNAYHRFTVDRHLLEATANAAALAGRVARPDLLLLGALLHDIGKGRPGDHTTVGIELIAEIGPRMGLSDGDTQVLVALCRHHLLLPDVATRRDLGDETTIAQVAESVGDVATLRLLAALTEADSLATGPAAWGRWKAELVQELVRRVEHHLDGGDPAALTAFEFPDATQRALLADGRVVVRGEGDVLTVVAEDQPGLFSRVAGVLAISGLEVRSAAVTTESAMALEVFTVTSRFGPTIDWPRVTAQVGVALDGRLAIEARLAERARTYAAKDRPARPDLPPPTVHFDDGASATATVVEVHARDRLGLLYRVTRAFAELRLDVRAARVQTVGELVIDAFYLTGDDGSLVADPALRRELERSLLHAVS
jgi:[protein-PII] uridylyltransferase